MSKKQFAIGVVIQAIDRVTAPVKGITASMQKMSALGRATEKAATASAGRRKRAEESESKKGGRSMAGDAWAKVTEGMGRVGGGIGKLGAMVPQVAALAIGVGSVVEGYKRVTAASDEALAAAQKLELVMLKVKGATKADVQAVMDLSGELQKSTAYGDEMYMGAASALSTFGMRGREVKAMLPALADYLALTKGVNATEEDAAAAAMLMGKAFSGNAGALKKQGIVLTKAQEQILKTGTRAEKTAILIRAIESRAGGLAKKQATGTPEGMRKLWENQLGEIEEKAGLALKPLREGALRLAGQALPYLEKFADMLPKIFDRGWDLIRKGWAFVTSAFGKGFAGADVSGFMSSFKSLGATVTGIFRRMQPFVSEMYTWAGKLAKALVSLWVRAQPGIKALLRGIEPIVGVFRNLMNKVLGPLLTWLAGTVAPFLLNILGPAFEWLGKRVAKSLNWIVDLFGGLIKWFGDAGSAAGRFFPNLWTKMRAGWQTFKFAMTSAWKGLFEQLFGWIETKWRGFLDLLKKVGEYLGFTSPQEQAANAARDAAAGATGGATGGSGGFVPRPTRRKLDRIPGNPNWDRNKGIPPMNPFGPGNVVQQVVLVDKTSNGVRVKASPRDRLAGVYLGQMGNVL